jgi:hypothetical protein
MKKLSFKVDVYDWDVYLYQLEAKDSKKDITKVLQKHNIPVEGNEDITTCLEDRFHDGGWTFCNGNIRQSVVIFEIFSEKAYKVDVYGHEKRHVEDDILNQLHVNDDDEAAAYLAGYLSRRFEELSEQVKKYYGKNKKKR